MKSILLQIVTLDGLGFLNLGLSSVSKSEKNPEVTGGNLPMWTKL